MDRLSAGQIDASILWLKSYRSELTGTWRAGEGKSSGKWDLKGVWEEREGSRPENSVWNSQPYYGGSVAGHKGRQQWACAGRGAGVRGLGRSLGR